MECVIYGAKESIRDQYLIAANRAEMAHYEAEEWKAAYEAVAGEEA